MDDIDELPGIDPNPTMRGDSDNALLSIVTPMARQQSASKSQQKRMKFPRQKSPSGLMNEVFNENNNKNNNNGAPITPLQSSKMPPKPIKQQSNNLELPITPYNNEINNNGTQNGK
eukprot:CAMPEP_0114656776 /NCGR_PEP_ID=MMETSP0191-20121206/12877_1 /TAXON_ID=126664 /ORGANISM="Sorites sp." /LENGTH=115 /DNA_ID=CAMNT_0001874719 /DNA_START=699 /DNA_END=1046 /DNA_ORIENTATION=-